MLSGLGASILVGSVVVGANYKHYYGGGNDHHKIVKICNNAGLYIKDDKTKGKKSIRIHRRSKFEGGMEYVYQIPLGMSFKDFQSKVDKIQDGLNNRKAVSDLKLEDFKQLRWDKTILTQISELLGKKVKVQKEVDLSWDGMLKVRVYDNPLASYVELTDEMLDSCKAWEIPLGISRNGLIKHDMEHGHMIVAGITRYGKTVFLKMLITSLVHRKHKDVKFSLIDLKGGLAFSRFQNLSQVNVVAHDAITAHTTLKSIVEEMKVIWEHFRKNGYEDIGEANIKTRHIVIVDEGAELSPNGFKDEDKTIRQECERYLSEIARLGAGLGIRLVFCTQYPTADILPRQVKQNSPTKIAFKLTNHTASEVVIDKSGAENLPLVKGRAIVLRDKYEEVQCPFVSNDFIQKKIEPHIRINFNSRSEENEATHIEGRTNRQDFTFTETTRILD